MNQPDTTDKTSDRPESQISFWYAAWCPQWPVTIHLSMKLLGSS